MASQEPQAQSPVVHLPVLAIRVNQGRMMKT
jgi:hypothetical protein